jgi:hypothetical protein
MDHTCCLETITRSEGFGRLLLLLLLLAVKRRVEKLFTVLFMLGLLGRLLGSCNKGWMIACCAINGRDSF